MKLRLPSLLLSAVVAAQLCTTANADVVGSGVSYDVGKLSYSSDPSITKADDSLYCWATSGANALQYWQDTYFEYSDNKSKTPNGIATSDTYEAPHGTNYLNIYQSVVNLNTADKNGEQGDLYKWWLVGTEYSAWGNTILPSQEGYYNNVVGSKENVNNVVKTRVSRSKADFASNLDKVFKTQGQVPGFTLMVLNADNPDLWAPVTYHAISCWGYETTKIDENNVVTSLILSDSDDTYFGAFRVDVTYLSDPTLGDLTVVSTDDEHSYYGQKYLAYLTDMAYIDTPQISYKKEGETVKVDMNAKGADALGSGHDLMRNTSLTKDETISNDNLTVGDGQQIVILTSSGAENLTLEGNGDKEAGLDVKAGSLVSLKNVSVSGYTNGGMNLDGHGYFDNGSLEITDNSKNGNGAGALNEHYMEVKGNETVTVSGNSATGNGGGIANDKDASLSISGNGTVSFSGNTAAKGKDIYNAAGATALIVNNKEVTFASGKSAVTNDGALYLGNTTDQKITFKDSTLDGNGTTYIGQDIRKNNYDGAVDFTEGKQTTSIKANKSGTPATLDKLSVSADEIIGTSAKASSVTGANIVSNGDLLMKNLTLDASDTIATTSGAINMTNTVIKLKDFASTTTTENGVKTYSFNLEDLVTSGTLTLNNVVFDTTGLDSLNIGENDSVLVTFSPAVELTDAQLSQGAGTNLRGELKEGTSNTVIFNGGNLAPEPATATLSLLALAALAARRKRH